MDLESKLLITAISAGSAIAGAVISQVVTIVRDFLDRKHQRNTLLRDKYEELAGHVTNSQEWSTQLTTAMTLRELHNNPPVHARKALVLAYLYFPLLRTSCEDYITSCVRLQTTLIDNHQFIEGVDCGTQAVHQNRHAVERSSGALREARQNLDEMIIAHAKKYAKA